MTPEERAAYYRGQIKGLEIAANCINDYIGEFSVTADALKHLEYIRSGISNAINMMSLRTP